MASNIQRRTALLIGLSAGVLGGIGAVLPDWGQIAATGDNTLVLLLHGPDFIRFLSGCIIASIIGLVAIRVLISKVEDA